MLIKLSYIFFQFSLHKIKVIDVNEAYLRSQKLGMQES